MTTFMVSKKKKKTQSNSSKISVLTIQLSIHENGIIISLGDDGSRDRENV